MTSTVHILTGAVIGKNIESPYLVITISIALHFLMDHLRHGEYVEVFDKNTSVKKSGWKVLLDIILGLSIILLFIHLKKLETWQTKNIIVGIFFSTLPDIITFLYWKFRWKFLEKYYAFHSWCHKYPRFSKEREWNWRNSFNDIIISLLAISLLFL